MALDLLEILIEPFGIETNVVLGHERMNEVF